MFALRRFKALDEGERMRRWQEKAETMCAQLQGIAGVEAEVALPTRGGRPLVIPRTRLRIDEQLEQGTPAIAVSIASGEIWLNPQHMADGEEEIVVRRVAEVKAQG